MRLRILRPSAEALDERVTRVRAEAPYPVGSFTLLPRHIDVATGLSQGLLSFTREGGEEVTVAVDGGTLVKVGDVVLVSTPNLIEGVDPEDLADAIRERFGQEEELSRQAGQALDRVGAGIRDRLAELEELGRRG